MSSLVQEPAPGSSILACAGDVVEVMLRLDRDRPGRAALRTNLGHAAVQRGEIIAHTETQRPFLARDWHDLPMETVAPGRFAVRVPLIEVGAFAAKACFIPSGSQVPEWPEGGNLAIKVAPAHTACANTVYSAFVRQFGPARRRDPRTDGRRRIEARLAAEGYAVIPPSGTFRDLLRHLDLILGRMHFRVLQLLPVHPVPTTYARMGRYGSAFAVLDFMAVDPSLAEFDRRTTPLDQFRELIDGVHARGATLFMDMPANHTGWASTLQIHHPDWFRVRADGAFESPGAWGITWEDLVALDYRQPALRSYMADVFLYWCRQGVDGFRCDAGYMIPAETWRYIVARVRDQYPDTVFLLEGLGGKIEVTEQLLAEADLDWAYSELFQTESRAAFEHYLPGAMALAERTGPLIHFAETHDNERLAARGEIHARMRTALAALLSHQGAFGVANGVEWFARERIDVHGAAALNWGSSLNQVPALATLNALLATHPAFGVHARAQLVQNGGGNALAVVRRPAEVGPGLEAGEILLVLINLDARHAQTVQWPHDLMPAGALHDLLGGGDLRVTAHHGHCRLDLSPGQVLCLSCDAAALRALQRVRRRGPGREPAQITARRLTLLALRARRWLGAVETLPAGVDAAALGRELARDPASFCIRQAGGHGVARLATWTWPVDVRRTVMIPPGCLLRVESAHPFRVRVRHGECAVAADSSVALAADRHLALLPVSHACVASAAEAADSVCLELDLHVFEPAGVQRACAPLLALAPGGLASVITQIDDNQVRADGRYALLTNGRGAMAQVRAAWGDVRSQYDALLAVNPDARVPVDRRVFWTRCRGWVVHCGYSQAIEAACVASFEADPGGTRASWRFIVPAGMGRWIPLSISLSLVRGRNRAVLRITRELAPAMPDVLEDAAPVTVVLRPDIEARCFHAKTKAFEGPEQQWPAAVQGEAAGFVFRPTPSEVYHLRSDVGTYHPAPEWCYQVGHPDDADRGLGGSSDLFSPGWFGMELCGGQRAHLTAAYEESDDAAAGEAAIVRPLPGRLPLGEALRRALDVYLVRRDQHHTVIAGYPWFLDWGRDTLIALRGVIADGRNELALDILCEFGRLERDGTLPNMIRGRDDANRDTSDAPLWFAVVAGDLLAVLGAPDVLGAPCGMRTLRDVLLSIVSHYRAGTPNGIRMDATTGLVYSPPHFTWMDTNLPAGTPRAGYPVEIQALWVATLDLVSKWIEPGWQPLAAQVRASLARLFTLPEGWLADCLRADPGVSAQVAVAEDALRPNQLLAVTLGALTDPACVRRIVSACECLLVPGALRSLADRPVRVAQPVRHAGRLLNDPVRPYWGAYRGDEDTRRKPAYHNGTAWTWVFPLYCEALLIAGGESARATALALLGSATVGINQGCVGQTPEILDGDAPHTARGCGAQAWGVSELLRVWKRCQPPPGASA